MISTCFQSPPDRAFPSALHVLRRSEAVQNEAADKLRADMETHDFFFSDLPILNALEKLPDCPGGQTSKCPEAAARFAYTSGYCLRMRHIREWDS